MTAGLKRFHTKSRNGCGQCKRRRVRCNLQGPICSNCLRRNEACDYLQGHDTQLSVNRVRRPLKPLVPIHESFHLLSCTDILSPHESHPRPGEKKEVLAPASTWSSQTQCARFALQRDGCVVETRNGAQEYLFPTLLSICDIFNAVEFEPDSQEIYAKAVHHNMMASATFRYAEQGISEDNWLPILMFGIGHIMFNFAAAQCAPDPAFDPLDVFHVLRGTARIGDEVGVYLERSGFGRLLDGERYSESLSSSSGPEDCLRAMDQLSLAEHPEGTSEATRAHCGHALERLKWWAQLVDGTPRSWKHFIIWPGSVTDEFVTALMQKQPVALLMYIYWCAVMCRAPRRWFADRWQRRVVSAASTHLDPSYAALLEWPIRTLGSPQYGDGIVAIGLASL